MSAQLLAAALLALAVLLGWLRLVLWQRAATGAGSARWRLALLALLQPLAAGALYLTLFPPSFVVGGGALVIATAGTAGLPAQRPGRLIALPEAPRLGGALALPDLATALRRFPSTRRLVVLGLGLEARDRDVARGLGIVFTPPPEPRGIAALAPPAPVAAGSAFAVAGRAAGVDGARVELVDPAGRVTDRQALGADGRFLLTGTARAAGTALFAVRLRTAGGGLVEEAEVPVLTLVADRPRLLLLAGAPGPEVKFLRRWATDAGFAVQAQFAVGGGIALGDPPIALTPATLAKVDVAIVDARAWAALGGGRAALLGAVSGGMGLLLRADGEPETRALWRELGLTLRGAGLRPVTLPGTAGGGAAAGGPDAAALLRTRVGIGSRDVPGDLALDDPALPEVARVSGEWQESDAVPFLADGGDQPLAAWRPLGEGRIAAFAAVDSYALAITGHADLFADWWSALLGTVARPSGSPALIAGPFWTGERAVLCGPGGLEAVIEPDGTRAGILPDRAAEGCAAFWPRQAGWHSVVGPGTGAGASRAVYVHPAAALPGLRAAVRRDATLRLAMTGARPGVAAGSLPGRAEQPGSPWPWFALWLLASAALWAFERAARGRGAVGPGPDRSV